MPKYGAGKLVDTFLFKDYGAVPVRFHKANGTFTAEVYGDEIRAASIKDLRAACQAAISENTGLAWQQAIEIGLLNDGRDDDAEYVIGLEYERFYWSVRPDGQLMRAHWSKYADDDDDKGVAPASLLSRAQAWEWTRSSSDDKRAFAPPCNYVGYGGATDYYIPYSPEVWIGLAKLADAIKDIRKRVIEIISTPAGHEILQAASVFLLAAPSDNEANHGR